MAEKFGYMIFPINLSVARINSEYYVGIRNNMYVISIADENANLTLKFDSSAATGILLKNGYNFKCDKDSTFTKIYLTNTAVASGTALLYFSYLLEIDTPFKIAEDILSYTIKPSVVLVGIAATAIPAIPLADRKFIILKNISVGTIYIGNSLVTVATGYPLLPNDRLALSAAQGLGIYGIGAVALNLNILEGS
jgi:hypothetical protein